MTLVEQLLKSAKIDAESTVAKAAKRLATTLKAGGISEGTQATILKSLLSGIPSDVGQAPEASQEPTTIELLKAKYGHVDVDQQSTASLLQAKYLTTPARVAAHQASDTASLLASKYFRFQS